MGVTRSPGWEEEKWDDAVQWGSSTCGLAEQEKAQMAEKRAWELIKGDFEFLPDSLRAESSWEALYRGVYAAFCAHKTSLCQAEAPAYIPFGLETWERVNVSADFKHSVMCLSRWYDDLVLGALDSQDDLYLRDVAVYRRHNKTYNLNPSSPAFDVLATETQGECEPSQSIVPLDAVMSLSAAVNERAEESRLGALTSWKGPWRDLFVRMPVRRLLLLEDDSYLQSWVCGDSVFGASDDEEEDPNAAVATAAMKRHQRSELLQRIARPHWDEADAGEVLSLMRAAAADLSHRPATPDLALRVLREHAGRLGLMEVRERLTGVQPGDPEMQTPQQQQQQQQQQQGQRQQGSSAADRKRGLMQRAMTELRHFVFPGLTDEEISDGTAEATVMYLSDSDVWQDGSSPGTNEHQPAANLAFFHRDMAVLITSHVPHC